MAAGSVVSLIAIGYSDGHISLRLALGGGVSCVCAILHLSPKTVASSALPYFVTSALPYFVNHQFFLFGSGGGGVVKVRCLSGRKVAAEPVQTISNVARPDGISGRYTPES